MIRVATTAIDRRIYAGHPAKDGQSFKGVRYDVTSDVLVAIRDKVGIGHEITVEYEGVPDFKIMVIKA